MVLFDGDLPIEEWQLWRQSRIGAVRVIIENGRAQKSTSQWFE